MYTLCIETKRNSGTIFSFVFFQYVSTAMSALFSLHYSLHQYTFQFLFSFSPLSPSLRLSVSPSSFSFPLSLSPFLFLLSSLPLSLSLSPSSSPFLSLSHSLSSLCCHQVIDMVKEETVSTKAKGKGGPGLFWVYPVDLISGVDIYVPGCLRSGVVNVGK